MDETLSDMLGEAWRLARELEGEVRSPAMRSRLLILGTLIEEARAIAPRRPVAPPRATHARLPDRIE